ncbi:MAG: zinc ribbon domain-containing protein [Candidatus Roizmanbacteria bacterium]|nr:zinc ribbon domain-containing protein [Candidatus Roizmanbacteria bacterium]
MYCHKCGKHNSENSKFCRYCGTRIDTQSGETTKDETKVKKSKFDLVWEKFVEVYNADDKDRKRFNALSSIYIWELLERLSVNAFEAFIQENKDELNKQPYKTIEELKNVYTSTVLGGYRLWLAEALLDDKEELNNFRSFSLDKFIDTWRGYDFDKALKDLSQEMDFCISKYSDFSFNTLMESVPEAKNLSNATVEKLKSSLLLQTINGYQAGKIETTFRK